MRRVRQSEIAERAGVSLTTVSRVVNQSGYVAEDVRKRVERAIEETGYVPTQHSFTRCKRLVGVVIPYGVLNPYFEKLTQCIHEECERQGYYAIFVNCRMVNNETLAAHAKQLSAIGVCGLIACCFNDEHLDEKTRNVLDKSNVPVVFIERTADCYGFNRILVDNMLGTYMAAKHLLDRGHKHLLYVTKKRPTEVERSRTGGFLKAMGEVPEGSVQYQVMTCPGVISPAAAFTAVKEAYEQDPEISGIMCWNDVYASGALSYTNQHGLNVPTDVEIIGSDDVMAGELSPPLSSVRMPLEEIALSAIEIIDKYQEPSDIPVARTVSLEPQLILR